MTFTGLGPVTAQYTVAGDCGPKTLTRTFDVVNCTVYKIRWTVWLDENENAIREPGEIGTNAGTGLMDGLWANLVGPDGKVLQSMPVNMNGTYELFTKNAGSYTVRITNKQIGEGVTITNPARVLPGDWRYTGHNDGTPCVVPSCTDPDIITGVTVNAGNPEVSNLDFGILSPKILPLRLKSFHVVKVGKAARMEWTTDGMDESVRFETHRSKDAINWLAIGQIQVDPSKCETDISYNFKDSSPEGGVNYYRLKQLGANGKFVYSKIKTVQFNEVTERIVAFPNPTTGGVQLSGLAGNETIRVYDYYGKLILKKIASETIDKIDLSHFVTGTYHIVITDANGKVTGIKLLKRD